MEHIKNKGQKVKGYLTMDKELNLNLQIYLNKEQREQFVLECGEIKEIRVNLVRTPKPKLKKPTPKQLREVFKGWGYSEKKIKKEIEDLKKNE